MPFVYTDETEWPDDEDHEPLAPRPDQFIYLPPPEFGGGLEPAAFSIAPPPDAAQRRPRGPFGRLFAGPPPRAKRSWEEEEEERMRWIFAIIVPAMRETGVRRVYCRYDGGNDEGFAWLDSVELRDGRRLSADALIRRLSGIRIHRSLYRTGVTREVAGLPGRKLREIIRRWLVGGWAAILLGRGFGTGEYSMYGAFTVDLEACVITDDPGADAVVKHIRLAR